MNIPTEPKPKPKTDEDHYAAKCSKCGGTGFFCRWVENGQPKSATGFDCWKCFGRGWQIRRKPKRKKKTAAPAEDAGVPF